MTKKAAILQSDYIPWKGYFDIINMVDVFVIFDDVQYTKNDWRNRNIIKTNDGLKWLTIPCRQKSHLQLINETFVLDKRWANKHWHCFQTYYSNTKYFKEYAAIIEDLYNESPKVKLSEINTYFIKSIMNILGIQTRIVFSHELGVKGKRTERLINICKIIGADVYLSGPKARNFLDIEAFTDERISVEWIDYSGYPEYHQLFPPFEHGVTILDLIFNEGPNARNYMKSFIPQPNFTQFSNPIL